MHPTVESSFPVCFPRQSQALRCASHRGVKLHTGESNCTLRSQNRNLCESLDAFKGTNRRNPFRDEHIYHERKDLKKFFLFAKPKILSPWCHAHYEIEFSNFVIKYLGKIETEFENTLACLSKAQVGWNHGKNRGRKSRDTLPISWADLRQL